MKAGVLKETWPGETRVAVVPGVLQPLAKAGIEVIVEAGAGEAAGYLDAAYVEKGARVDSRDAVLAEARLLLSVRSFAGSHDFGAVAKLGREHVVVGFLDPLQRAEGLKSLAASGATSFALELMPRITRAQSMDALSSMATIAGYKAVLLAADALPQHVPDADDGRRDVVARARVRHRRRRRRAAGDRHGAAARRGGRGLRRAPGRQGTDPEPRRTFVELPLETAAAEDKGGYAKAQDEAFYRRQRELLAKVVADSDVVITTAAVPGKKAPVLVTEDMVQGDAPGLGDRRPRRRAGRQLRADRRRRDGRPRTASGSWAR